MRIHYIIIISILLVSSSCKDAKYDYEKQFLIHYSEAKSIFKYELTDHFPNELKMDKKLYISFPSKAKEKGMANFFLSQLLDSIEFNQVVQKLRNNEYIPRDPKDSSFIIIGDTINYLDKVNGIPVPSFLSYDSAFGINHRLLSSNHKIYVLESKSGKFMEEEYLTSNSKLPPEWKNGFSRGIATNEIEKEVIYWLCVW